jgi:very-short-patch-repair endonuclease
MADRSSYISRVQGSYLMIPKPLRAPTSVQQRAKELRHGMTPAEQILWERLRDHRLSGLKFRRQHPIRAFIVDFYCAVARLVIEIDGSVHRQQVEADTLRTQELEAQDYQILRFTNQQVESDLESVLADIQATCQSKTPLPNLGEGPKPFFGVG